ncbi:MAG: IPTL-CTERM sorting domain-containing protein [Gammaproteobacteria bacterium]
MQDSGGTTNGGIDTSAAQTFTITVNPPADDGDGIPAPTEDQAANSGDGNQDGTPDRDQPFVTSFPASTGQTITIANETGKFQQLNLSASAPPANVPADLSFPFGVFGFTVQGVPANGAVPMAIYVPATPAVTGYFKPDAQGQWTNIATGITTVGGQQRIAFSITDNGPFDADPTPGTIRDPGGPAIQAGPTPIPTLSQWAQALAALVLGGLGWLEMRRKTKPRA